MRNLRAEELICDNPAVGKMSKKELFNAYREIYAPDFGGSLTPENEKEIKSAMYAAMFDDKIDELIAAQNESTYAFMQFAQLNDVYYKKVVKDRNYKAQSVYESAMWDFFIRHYGKVIGKFKNITYELAEFGVLTAIAVIICIIISGVFGSKLFTHIANVFGAIFVLQHICGILSAPLDFLLYFPKRIWRGIKTGVEKGYSIFIPISILFHVAIKLVLGVLAFVFLPGIAYEGDRTNRLRKTKDYQKFAAEVVDARFARTLKSLKRFREKAGAEVYKNTVDAIGYYNYQSEDIVGDAINSGRDMLRREGSFYFAEKERLEEKIDQAKDAIIDAREKKEKEDKKAYDQVFNNPVDEFFERFPSGYEMEFRSYFDSVEYQAHEAVERYESMVKSNEELFQLTKDEKLGEIDVLTKNLSILEKRINLAALTKTYNCKFNIHS